MLHTIQLSSFTILPIYLFVEVRLLIQPASSSILFSISLCFCEFSLLFIVGKFFKVLNMCGAKINNRENFFESNDCPLMIFLCKYWCEFPWVKRPEVSADRSSRCHSNIFPAKFFLAAPVFSQVWQRSRLSPPLFTSTWVMPSCFFHSRRHSYHKRLFIEWNSLKILSGCH